MVWTNWEILTKRKLDKEPSVLYTKMKMVYRTYINDYTCTAIWLYKCCRNYENVFNLTNPLFVYSLVIRAFFVIDTFPYIQYIQIIICRHNKSKVLIAKTGSCYTMITRITVLLQCNDILLTSYLWYWLRVIFLAKESNSFIFRLWLGN